MVQAEEDMTEIFLKNIGDLSKVNLEEIINIMLEKKQDGEKV